MADIPYEIQVECNKDDNRKKAYKAECKLAIVELRSQEQSGALMVLMDDEELELRELQAGPNPLACSHLAIDGRHSCSLCKGLSLVLPKLFLNYYCLKIFTNYSN